MPNRKENMKKHNETKTWAQRRGLGKEVREMEAEGGKGEVVKEMAKNKEPKPKKEKEVPEVPEVPEEPEVPEVPEEPEVEEPAE